MGDEGLKRTPLYDEHKAAGARLVPFAGWEMPVQYEGVRAEHGAVRTRAGLFDVSHMGEVVFRGPEAEAAVQRLVTRDVSRLEAGQAGYAAVCYESGGTVDDVLVYKRSDEFLVVVNAANREKDVAHFLDNAGGFDVDITDESDEWALLALQGPEAREILQTFTDADLAGLRYYRFVEAEVNGAPAIVSRTGYTGEDGFELYVRPDDAPALWRALLDAGVAPVGLGARDTLRLEAGMCLYGNELDPETTPLEAGIGFAVHLNKEQEFVGREALRKEKEEGLRKKLVGFKVEGRGIARHGHAVAVEGEDVGIVTSGTQSPTLGEAIGLALVTPEVEDSFDVIIRDRPVAAKVVPIPFYRREKR
jgi:aminomethyltransferase